jgi:hypothetical protein
MKTLFNLTYSKGCTNLRGSRHIVGAMSEMHEVLFSVEVVVGARHSFCSILLEAIDDVDPVANEERTANS